MAYRTLKSVFHQRDAGAAELEENTRRRSPAAMNWDFDLGEYQMFAVATPEMMALIERIMSMEPKVVAEWLALPIVARDHCFLSAIVDEVQATNDIEQVRSTRREVRAALDSLAGETSARDKRFTEMVRLYRSLGDDETARPETLDDIRRLYDAVAEGEIAAEDDPDGTRFRRGPVDIQSGTRVVHSGLTPESAIEDGLAEMLRQSRDDDLPQLVRAVVAHFLFEYIHPFYDGNGRTGRFLLALELRSSLAPIACLSLSTTIGEHKDRYYTAFAEAEQPLNRGDITPFIIVMLEIIAEAEHRLLIDLQHRRTAIDRLGVRLTSLVASADIGDQTIADLLHILGQAWLFGGPVTLKELTHHSGRSTGFVRGRMRTLVDDGLVDEVTRKPLRFQLSQTGRDLLQLEVDQ